MITQKKQNITETPVISEIGGLMQNRHMFEASLRSTARPRMCLVCVCVRERKREKETQTETEKWRQRQRENVLKLQIYNAQTQKKLNKPNKVSEI